MKHGFADLAGDDHPALHSNLGLSIEPDGMITKGAMFHADSDYLSTPGTLVKGLTYAVSLRFMTKGLSLCHNFLAEPAH